jgi:gliding motility-associated-like protein
MRNFTIFKIILLLIFSYTETISAQIVIGAPSLGFSQACASDSFNTYNVTFSFSPESALGAANQFIIELSDETGSFANPTIVFSSNSGAVTVSPATLSFSLPNTTAGEGFKIRIKSTAPVATSSNSIAFPAYFKIQDTPFSINNLVSTGAYCSDSSYLLTIDNPGYGSNDSPLQYPSLTFNWYKETSPTTSVFVATGSSLSVSEPGTYFVETNYGTCTSNSFSNRVTVTEATSSATSSISSSLGNPYCSSQGSTTLSTIAGNSYQWYKDGTAITGATSQMYITNEAATYSVTINLGSCVANASIDLQNNGFTSSIDVTDTNIINEGETLLVTVTTTANSPDFQWYLNESIISGANGNSFEVTEIGNYKVVVSQTSGCISSTEFLFNVTEPFPDVANIPNLISPNGDGINDTWIIPQEYVNGTNTEVMILNSQGKMELRTNNYQNNWPENEIKFKDINPVYYYIITTQNKKTLKGSITVVK